MPILAIARHQLLLMERDTRLRWLCLALLMLAVASLVTGAARQQAQTAERQAAAVTDEEIWDALGPVNPHGAAHTGRNLYAPLSPLAAFDPGLSNYLGISVRAEAHTRNPARDRPMEGGTSITRFAGFSPAWALQVVVPLLIILSGFTIFSGERACERLRQELGAGASGPALMFGRFIGLGTAAIGLLGIFMAAGIVALLSIGAPADAFLALLAMGGGYALYLLVHAGLTVSISALLPSARSALVVLLGLWACTTLLLPRIAPAMAERLYPTPSAPAFENAVTDEAKNGISGHDPYDARLNAVKADLMQQHGVTRIEDLPFNFEGVALQFGEGNTSETYNRHYEALFATYHRQNQTQRLFSLISPTLAMIPWSRAMAGTDVAAHRLFLHDAEKYRFALIQALNDDIRRNKPKDGGIYRTDVSALAEGVRFTPRLVITADAWRDQAPSLAILAVWLAACLAFARWAATRLERRA
ncbi:DUF3526 domain-containing protein [Niveispirillum sp.]|uniref:DUF3526 domain-containing protein n=1 Tax=Niveispirillum sp. TaxID=1917217 RepID=UPI001B7536F5|nr:DUF3526 domain-containing protein [Niveispirillum sp.]MBP7339235.1 DUF3526 domain-containing protein [Niveispirillum sp.]